MSYVTILTVNMLETSSQKRRNKRGNQVNGRPMGGLIGTIRHKMQTKGTK